MSIRLEEVSLIYHPGTPFQTAALECITCTMTKGDITGITGPTGSGKSTLLQLLNGLLKPSLGQVFIDGERIDQLGGEKLTQLRRKVALAFQFPEKQVFELTVREDIAFGPRQLGLRGEELENRVCWAMEQVGLPPARYAERTCASLSGGQKRLVALAGIVAMRPDYVLLDEPWAGLDAVARQHLKQFILRLKGEGTTVVLVSHDLEDLVEISDRLLLLKEGRLIMQGPTRTVLNHCSELVASGIEVPVWHRVLLEIKKRCPEINLAVTDVEEAADELERLLRSAHLRCRSRKQEHSGSRENGA